MVTVIPLLFLDRGTRREWVVSSTPRPHFTPGERPGTHFTGGWLGPGAGLDGRKISSHSGIRSRTVQPVVSRYTYWATGPILTISMYWYLVVKEDKSVWWAATPVTTIINIALLVTKAVCDCGTQICIISRTAGWTARQTVNRICISRVERMGGPQLWSEREGLNQNPRSYMLLLTCNFHSTGGTKYITVACC